MANTNESSKSLPVGGRITATVTPAPLTAEVDFGHQLREIIVQAHPDNTDNVEIGPETTPSFVLQPGEAFGIPLQNPHELWVKAVSGEQVLNYIGRD